MTWEELYPIVKETAYWSILRYDPRRADKIQELVCQSYQKYLSDIERGIEPQKNIYKYFVSKRAREIDLRSICLKGAGGTSSLDTLSFVNRRSTAPISVVEFAEWLACSGARSKQLVDDTLAFNVDYKDWLERLTKIQKRVLTCLVEGYRTTQIAKMIHATAGTVKQVIRQLQELFVEYFVCA